MRLSLLMIAMLALSACTKSAPSTGSSGETPHPQQAPVPDGSPVTTPTISVAKDDPCDALRDSVFRSVKYFGTGLGEDGKPAMDKIMIQFLNQVVKYQVTDTWEQAPYACVDGAITASTDRGELRGHYDAVKDKLTWNGNEYDRVKQ